MTKLNIVHTIERLAPCRGTLFSMQKARSADAPTGRPRCHRLAIDAALTRQEAEFRALAT